MNNYDNLSKKKIYSLMPVKKKNTSGLLNWINTWTKTLATNNWFESVTTATNLADKDPIHLNFLQFTDSRYESTKMCLGGKKIIITEETKQNNVS